jgi:hypothetical protein
MSSADRRTKRRPWLSTALGLFQCAGVFFGVYSGRLLSLPWWGQVLIILAVTVLVVILAMILVHGIPATIVDFFRQLYAAVKRAAKWTILGSPGVAVALVAFLLATNVRWLSAIADESCPEPIDLRVATGPENVSSLTNAARRYVADKSRGGCRTATVSVTASPSIDELTEGFANGWTSPGSEPDGGDCQHLPARVTLLGPRPDIWVPGSRAIAEKVRQDLKPEGVCGLNENPVRVTADLAIHGSVASSPVVMGVFADANRPDLGGDPGKQSLSSLLQSFRTDQVLNSVARPSPDASESGLLSTPVLHQALRDAGWTGEAEKLLDQSRISAGDMTSLLCGLREDDAAGKAPPGDTAVILPESALARYDYGDELGQESACRGRTPSPKWRLFPFYTGDLPVLEYPFVHVRWPGEDTDRRNQAVEDFRKWLEDDELAREGFRTASGGLSADNPRLTALRNGGNAVPEVMPPHPLRGDTGCIESLSQVLDCYNRARPANPLTLLLDISGSMANPVAMGGPRLARAQQLAQRIVAGVRTGTPISLFAFSDVTQPKSEPVRSSDNATARDAVLGDIQRATVNGRDLPLTTAVGQTVDQLRRGKQTLVLLTDGQVPGTNPGYADQARKLAERLREQNRRVLIVPTGPSGCHDQPVAAVVGALRELHEGTCVEDPKATVDDLAHTITYEISWGSD